MPCRDRPANQPLHLSASLGHGVTRACECLFVVQRLQDVRGVHPAGRTGVGVERKHFHERQSEYVAGVRRITELFQASADALRRLLGGEVHGEREQGLPRGEVVLQLSMGDACLPCDLAQAQVLHSAQVHHWRPETLPEPEQLLLKTVRTHCPETDALTRHVRAFAVMLTERQGERLPDRLVAVRQDDLPSLRTLAVGIDRDRDAVIAGLTLLWSSGAVEGHVNRIKMIKRQMYGRAGFKLLRKRVLLAS